MISPPVAANSAETPCPTKKCIRCPHIKFFPGWITSSVFTASAPHATNRHDEAKIPKRVLSRVTIFDMQTVCPYEPFRKYPTRADSRREPAGTRWIRAVPDVFVVCVPFLALLFTSFVALTRARIPFARPLGLNPRAHPSPTRVLSHLADPHPSNLVFRPGPLPRPSEAPSPADFAVEAPQITRSHHVIALDLRERTFRVVSYRN